MLGRLYSIMNDSFEGGALGQTLYQASRQVNKLNAAKELTLAKRLQKRVEDATVAKDRSLGLLDSAKPPLRVYVHQKLRLFGSLKAKWCCVNLLQEREEGPRLGYTSMFQSESCNSRICSESSEAGKFLARANLRVS